MNIKYESLFHGPFTNKQKEESHSIFYNQELKQDLDANFILIEKDIDDFDLFELIHEESNAAKDSNQDFIHLVYENKLENLSLLESLRFEIEWIDLYKLKKENQFVKKTSDTHKVIQLNKENLSLFLKSFKDESLEYQNMIGKKMFNLLKNKNAKTLFIQENDELIGKITSISNKEFVEIQNFEINVNKRNQGLGRLLHDQVLGEKDTVLLCFKDSDAALVYESWGYEIVSSHLSAIKSL